MTEKLLLQSIRDGFPGLRWKRHRYLGHGFDHDVIILDNRVVFRAPRNEHYRNLLPDEVRLLQHLRSKIPVRIPDYQYVTPDCSLAGYPLLPGRELNQPRFKRLSAADKETAANQMAGFLSALHAVPEELATKFKTPVLDFKQRYELLAQRCRELLYPRFIQTEIDVLEAYLERLKASFSQIKNLTLAHQDLLPDHILWDRATRQISIIDFSDRAWADPALDFAGILFYGDKFVKRVLDMYRGSPDSGLPERARLYNMRVPLYLMTDALMGLPCSYEEGYALFRKLFFQTGSISDQR